MNKLEIIQDSINFIEENLEEDLSLEELAGHAHLSKFHFHRLFHSAAGESVGDYIRKRRLTEAASELCETNDKIVDIALKYHFGSQESFARAFKRAYGLSPSEYRRKQVNTLLLRRIDILRRTQTSIPCTILRAA